MKKSEKKKNRLGKGVESLFSDDEVADEAVVKEEAKEGTTEDPTKGVDVAALKQAMAMVKAKKPVVSVWSPQIKTCLKYLILTQPAFKESVEAAGMLEKAMKKKYPEVWRRVQQALS